ncbi:MAG: response regulator [Candidatus Kuenenia sp.]|nr:response regulator [Candidatus Kuenenia hertensis]
MMKVVIADDSMTIRSITRDYFEKMGVPKQNIYEASNGKTALELVINEKPDILLLDMVMPEMAGMEVLEELNRRSVPTVVGVVSSFGTKYYVEKAKSLGVQFFIDKPLIYEKLVDELKKAGIL